MNIIQFNLSEKNINLNRSDLSILLSMGKINGIIAVDSSSLDSSIKNPLGSVLKFSGYTINLPESIKIKEQTPVQVGLRKVSGEIIIDVYLKNTKKEVVSVNFPRSSYTILKFPPSAEHQPVSNAYEGLVRQNKFNNKSTAGLFFSTSFQSQPPLELKSNDVLVFNARLMNKVSPSFAKSPYQFNSEPLQVASNKSWVGQEFPKMSSKLEFYKSEFENLKSQSLNFQEFSQKMKVKLTSATVVDSIVNVLMKNVFGAKNNVQNLLKSVGVMQESAMLRSSSDFKPDIMKTLKSELGRLAFLINKDPSVPFDFGSEKLGVEGLLKSIESLVIKNDQSSVSFLSQGKGEFVVPFLFDGSHTPLLIDIEKKQDESGESFFDVELSFHLEKYGQINVLLTYFFESKRTMVKFYCSPDLSNLVTSESKTLLDMASASGLEIHSIKVYPPKKNEEKNNNGGLIDERI